MVDEDLSGSFEYYLGKWGWVGSTVGEYKRPEVRDVLFMVVWMDDCATIWWLLHLVRSNHKGHYLAISAIHGSA